MPTAGERVLPELIVNADDFGLSRGVSRGILEAHRFGTVTAASAMVNFPDWPAWARDASAQGLDLGLHVNLLTGPMLTSNRYLTKYFGGRHGLYGLIGLSLIGRLPIQEIEREITAQFDRFEDALGRAPSHVDGHCHVQMLPPVRMLIEQEASRRKIFFLRNPMDVLSPNHPKNRIIRMFKSSDGKNKFPVPFTGHHLLGTQRSMSIPMPVSSCPPLLEWMVHCGWADEQARRLDVYAEERERELHFLTRTGTLAQIKNHFTLTTFQSALFRISQNFASAVSSQ